MGDEMRGKDKRGKKEGQNEDGSEGWMWVGGGGAPHAITVTLHSKKHTDKTRHYSTLQRKPCNGVAILDGHQLFTSQETC